MPVTLSIERPDQKDVVALIRASHAYMASLYPAESNHGFDVAELLAPEVVFVVARADGRVLACGAIVRGEAGAGELKSMWVDPACRGQGVGRALLDRLEGIARSEGLRVLRLETGIRQPEALALYRRAGYEETEPFGAYRPDPLSVFMAKRLDATGPPEPAADEAGSGGSARR